MIIGLYTPDPQSGKGTFATELLRLVPGAQVITFADPLRAALVPIVAPFFDGGEPEVWEWFSDWRKDQKLIPVLGVTLRHCMQTIGTDWGRRLVHPDVWVFHAQQALRRVRGTVPLVVFDDLRMENEYTWLRKEGAELVRIERPDAPPAKEHDSNRALEGLAFDYNIINTGVEHLRFNAQAVVWDLGYE